MSSYAPPVLTTFGTNDKNSSARIESKIVADPDMQKNLERLIDTVAFSTFHFFFGDI
jgi:hypothetical protein